ncbi:hypothetical protein GCM10011414_02770 [Croceivirga lutea]|uniref:hypothetical protein n=1 Tax=Croceivirga lutea TaxID=1775167 RepID=UPI00163AD940|nr:hypothetical protein [Croceivirga lutea]GGG36850.1 hypothetical protein GCM10011414_02770 [Croceivirga lutea]
MTTTETRTTQKINLVEGEFSASEALDVVQSLLNEKINFHKLQRLSWSEGCSTADTAYPDSRIQELENEKKILKDFIAQIRQHGNKLRIHGTLNISLVEEN